MVAVLGVTEVVDVADVGDHLPAVDLDHQGRGIVDAVAGEPLVMAADNLDRALLQVALQGGVSSRPVLVPVS
jgi:hypothetical protein